VKDNLLVEDALRQPPAHDHPPEVLLAMIFSRRAATEHVPAPKKPPLALHGHITKLASRNTEYVEYAMQSE